MHQTLRFPNTQKRKKSLHASAFQMTTSLQESSTTSPLCCIQKVVIDGAPPWVNFHLERQNDIVLAHMMSTQQSGGEIKEKKRTKRSHHERNKTHTHWFTRGFVLLCLKAFTEKVKRGGGSEKWTIHQGSAACRYKVWNLLSAWQESRVNVAEHKAAQLKRT